MRLRGDKETKPLPFLVTPKDERYAEFSPDGNYVAYASDESGRYEVYVKPFPSGEGKSQVSIAGGTVVMLQGEEQQSPSQKLIVTQNWFAEFRERQK